MRKVSFSDGLAIVGLILAIVLVVLDKAGKLNRPLLLTLLGVAACMAIPLLFSVPWVNNARSGLILFIRRALMICLLASAWAGLSVWITNSDVREIPSDPVLRITDWERLPNPLSPNQVLTAHLHLVNSTNRPVSIVFPHSITPVNYRPEQLSISERKLREEEIWDKSIKPYKNGLNCKCEPSEIPAKMLDYWIPLDYSNQLLTQNDIQALHTNSALYFMGLMADIHGHVLLEFCAFTGMDDATIRFCVVHNGQ